MYVEGILSGSSVLGYTHTQHSITNLVHFIRVTMYHALLCVQIAAIFQGEIGVKGFRGLRGPDGQKVS